MLNIAAVNPDRPGSCLVAIENHIISIRKDLRRISFKLGQVFQLGHGKWMMGCIPFFIFFVPLKHWKIQHPAKSQQIWVGQVKLIAEVQPQRRKGLVGHFLTISYKQHQIPRFCASAFLYGGHFFRFDEFLGRAFHTLGG